MSDIKVSITGPVSTFGGPNDTGVSPSEGLALFSKDDLWKPISVGLFLPTQPPGTTGVARRLNPKALYIAMRWDYKELPVDKLRGMTVTVSANGKSVPGVRPVDWGPNIGTARVMDISPGLAKVLNLATDGEATVTYSYVLRSRPFANRSRNLRGNAASRKRRLKPARKAGHLGKPRKILASESNTKGKVQKRGQKAAG